jgi:uncharacterized protein (DUF2252 family)
MTTTTASVASRAGEQRSAGRARRTEVPRSEHAAWAPPAGRADPVGLVEAEDAGRVPDLVPIRHARMAPSAFTFYRGTASIMAADLASLPSTGILVQSCGDAHLSNFGVFATPERRLAFDLNDFDETHPAPFEWDVKRLAASFVVAGRDNGFDDRESALAAERSTACYQAAIHVAAERPFLDVWYDRIDVDRVMAAVAHGASKQARKAAEKQVRKARTRTSLSALRKLAEQTPDGWRIRHDPPVVVSYPGREAVRPQLEDLFARYAETLQADHRRLFEQYELADFARKVVGVGSVGTEAFIFLLVGPQGDDPLFLQLKQAEASVLAPFVEPDVAPPVHQGRRVVEGQRLMQAASDVFLGWTSGGRDGAQEFYVRQLRDMKGSAEIAAMSPAALCAYADLCGAALARAHARSGAAPQIAGYLGGKGAFASAVTRFALAYADQAQSDYEAFSAAIASGALEAEAG